MRNNNFLIYDKNPEKEIPWMVACYKCQYV